MVLMEIFSIKGIVPLQQRKLAETDREHIPPKDWGVGGFALHGTIVFEKKGYALFFRAMLL